MAGPLLNGGGPMAVTIETLRFGELGYRPEQLLVFPGGLIGLPEMKRFIVLAPNGPQGPLYWLQSADRGDLALVAADVAQVAPAYKPVVGQDELHSLGLSSIGEAMVLGVCVLGDTPASSTINLLAPLIVNPVNRLGRQVLLDDANWSARHPLVTAEEG